MNNIETARPLPRMRTIRETAKITGFPEHALRVLVQQNKIIFVRCGSKVLINYDRFLDYLNRGEQA